MSLASEVHTALVNNFWLISYLKHGHGKDKLFSRKKNLISLMQICYQNIVYENLMANI